MDSISNHLDKQRVMYIRIDGHTASEARNVNCDKFQRDDRCRVALLSITAANAGTANAVTI